MRLYAYSISKPKVIAIVILQVLLQLIAIDRIEAKGIDSTFLNRFSLHFQLTTVSQYHPDFAAKYSGDNSLQTHEGIQSTVTSTLMLGCRLWKGAEIYFDPELSGGSGFSLARGVAGFPNGEAFRVGDPKPAIYVARGYFKQTFNFSKESLIVDDDDNQVATTAPKHGLSITFGKFGLADFIDDNDYSHDARRQFLNWALMSNGAWDYPANTRGYTFGVVVDYRYYDWSLRASTSLMPTTANGNELDWRLDRSNSEALELERRYNIFSRKGTIRAMGYFTMAHMGSYAEAIKMDTPDISASRKFSRLKAGFGINLQQEILPFMSFFARGSWNDGHNETWAFAEIDRAFSAGFSFTGHPWRRMDDGAGIAIAVNGLSADHRKYIAAGGYGFMIGDGQLNYAPEFITEVYYSFKPFKKWLWITPDYQFVLHPAYNKDRGPVHIVGLRLHVGI